MKNLASVFYGIDKNYRTIIVNVIKHMLNASLQSTNPAETSKRLALIYSTVLFGKNAPSSKNIDDIVDETNVILNKILKFF